MKTKLLLYKKWGITFDEPYRIPEQSSRTVYYADRLRIQEAIDKKYGSHEVDEEIIQINLNNRNGVKI